ncbi:unnamed protein product [Notodromas monacha]|uniref:Uncharacterized protein n=1 Tax=Notodromas monacha TaxID=399045 RepID=A0A7R9GDV6_9CRUS|nr:unnamed protein product [Notodromas monacha]CAG0919103.1 unnamed protein product [Notodromas monacha]
MAFAVNLPSTKEEKLEKQKKQRNQKIKKYALIGVATVGGGALVGLTGGLAAPLIGAGVGTLLGGAGAAAAISSTTGMAVVGSMFGVAGAGLTGFKMQKRVGDVEEFAFDYLTEGTELHITIAVSGWLSEKSNLTSVSIPWRTLYNSRIYRKILVK